MNSGRGGGETTEEDENREGRGEAELKGALLLAARKVGEDESHSESGGGAVFTVWVGQWIGA